MSRLRDQVQRVPLPQSLYGVKDSDTLSDALYPHFLERLLVQIEDNVALDVVRFEHVRQLPNLVLGEPAGDVGVGPFLYQFEESHSRRGFEEV